MQPEQESVLYHSTVDNALIKELSLGDTGTGSIVIGDGWPWYYWQRQFSYDFEDYFHPFLAELIDKLNQTSVAGMLDPDFLGGLYRDFTAYDYTPQNTNNLLETVSVQIEPGVIDVSVGGPYAAYNWELLYHIPVAVAVHLSQNQRFAEAQQWFHLVFDPTSTDTATPAPQRYWRSFALRSVQSVQNINTLLTLLSTPDSQLDAAQRKVKADVLTGYNAILAHPFNPHLVAQSRPGAYQWYVVMKYLDNLIAWGDSLFQADTVETLNEATLCYVLASEILGPRPQNLPQPGSASPRTFRQLKQAGLDRMSNAMVELESQFPFNLAPASAGSGSGAGPGGGGSTSGALFGLGRSLYFRVPANKKLLAYWDTVADRLFKIRNSENLQGMAQRLPLFQPPLDPGMLVRAAAAGIDLGSIVNGLNQPTGPLRAPVLIQKALELASEVRSLGAELLSAIEKGESEKLAQLRAGQEVSVQQMTQEIRFLQWKNAEETTNALLKSHAVAYERYSYFLQLLQMTPDPAVTPADFAANRSTLTEATFSDLYNTLVGQYEATIADLPYNSPPPSKGFSPASQSGAGGKGNLFLNNNEDSEINNHLPTARDLHIAANVFRAVAAVVTPIPSAELHAAFWGIGIHSKLFDGRVLGELAKLTGQVLETVATYHTDQAAIDQRTGGFLRRADEWVHMANSAGRELTQIGRQIIASLISEQAARSAYDTTKAQVQQAQDVQNFLQTKFTDAALYDWMQGELSALYYQYYQFACATARQAEQTMKTELMQPQLDATTFIQPNYWDGGHQGLLSGEALYLDVKRMELAYKDNDKRELELTRHVSLRQLDPLALLTLRITGQCNVTVPEWLYDRDCPGHYMRRIKSLSISVPSVTGPYTPVNCTATLQNSTLRVSPLLANGVYARAAGQEDDRFRDLYGSTDVIVTSGGVNDSGMFEPDPRGERFLPFEGAGAVSTWNLSLPQLAAFDYSTISDLILHIRYTARPAGNPLAAQATKELAAMLDTAGSSSQALMFCLRLDFPTEWSAFTAGAPGTPFKVTLSRQLFPYAVQSARKLTLDSLTLYADKPGGTGSIAVATPTADLTALSAGLTGATGEALLSLNADGSVLTQDPAQQVFLVMQYHYGMS